MKHLFVTLVTAILAATMLIGCVSMPTKGGDGSKNSFMDKRTKIVMPDKSPPGYREKVMRCVDEANARLRDFGQPEIVVISQQEAQKNRLTTVGLATGAVVAAPIILPATLVSGALMGGLGFLYNKKASDRDSQIEAEVYVSQCIQAAEQQETMRQMRR